MPWSALPPSGACGGVTYGEAILRSRMGSSKIWSDWRSARAIRLFCFRHGMLSGAPLSFPAKLAAALDWARSGLALYDPAACQSEIYRLSGHDPAVCGHATLAQALWVLGYPDQAAEKIDDALRLARQLTHASSLANALVNAVDLQLLRGDAAPLRELAEQLIALAIEQGFAGYLDRGKFARGWAMVLQDQGDEGTVLMREALLTLQGRYRAAFYRALLVEAHRRTGQLAVALRLADREFSDDSSVWPEPWLAAEVVRLIGEAHASAAPDQHAVAEARFNMALELARRQGAKSLELRAAMSLARLWRSQGRVAQACDLLAPIFDWFTEGFDTPDLKDAKSLLDAPR